MVSWVAHRLPAVEFRIEIRLCGKLKLNLKFTSSTTACTASELIAGDASFFSSILSVAADARTLGFWLGPTEIFDTQ